MIYKTFFYAFFLIHGFLSLICQVLWQRELILVLGGSVYSTTIILMAYMSGLALGNFWAGKLMTRFRHEYRLLAWIQVAIGIFIFIFPLLLIGVDAISDFLFPLSTRHHFFYLFIKALIAFLVLLVPSSLIGVCFPVLVSLFERMKVSRNIFIGKLNFLNSLGSVLGALMTGFVLIYFLGARTSLALAGALFVLSGILVLGISLRKPPGIGIPVSPVPESGSWPEKLVMDIPLKPAVLRSLLILLFFCSGFTALSYELLYNRILIYFLGNTTFSFTLIVSFFILGYSLGSFIFYKFMNRNQKI
ncbi:MAG: fused MFS/spermidine synthase, partial [Candidatus Aminicenantes bacterium]|nr:fused MFS/spermidine synthase [Candidatus Aminicenantes bacterium]